MMPVIRPPVRNEMSFGKALAKSFAGETTLAAILTDSVATTTVNIEIGDDDRLRELADELYRVPGVGRDSYAGKQRPPPK